MTWGEVFKKDIIYIDNTIFARGITGVIELPIPSNIFAKCCYKQTVFAKVGDADEYKNDFTGFIQFFPSIYTVTMHLEKVNALGQWATVTALANNAYGTLFANLRTINQLKPFGYKLQWQFVLDDFGAGNYRVRWSTSSTGDIFSNEFCLKSYESDLADETVRIEYMLNSVIGTKYQDVTINYSGLNWRNQIRVENSIFGYPNASIETESVRLTTGEEKTVRKEYRQKYILEMREIPKELSDVIIYEVALADEILITDYNSTNPVGNFVNESVELEGEIAPRYLQEPKMTLTLNLVDKFNNRRRLYR